MSEKTITRYYGSTGKPMCLLSDHEAALAAERENTRIADNLADHWEKQANKATQDAAAKDARIAKYKDALARANSLAEEMERKWYLRGDELASLRTAIEAKAREFDRLADEHEAWGKHYAELTHARKLVEAEVAQLRRAATELRALLGEGK